MISKAFLFALVGGSVICATAADTDPKAEIGAAIASLSGKPNYSWVARSKSEDSAASARSAPTEGKAEKDGYTYFKLTMGDNTVEAALKGPKSVIKTEADWESSQDKKGDGAWIARRLSAFKAPVAEAQDLLAKVKALKKERGGAYSGDLTEVGARELLFARSREAQVRWPTGSKGWVKFWIKNGVLTQYEYNLQGRVAGQNQQEHEVNRTTTVEIKSIGSTKVQIPEEAKKKLGP